MVWGYLYQPPDTVFRFMAITGTMYIASILLTIALGLYWKKANTVGAFASMIIGALLPLAAIFIKDSNVLPDAFKWLSSDKLVGTATYILAVLGMIAFSLLTQKISPPKQLACGKE